MKARSRKSKAKHAVKARIVKIGGLKVWTGEVPPIPLEEAVDQARHYQR